MHIVSIDSGVGISFYIIFTSQNDGCFIALDKRAFQINIFLISPQKFMLWVLIRSASVRHF